MTTWQCEGNIIVYADLAEKKCDWRANHIDSPVLHRNVGGLHLYENVDLAARFEDYGTFQLANRTMITVISKLQQSTE